MRELSRLRHFRCQFPPPAPPAPPPPPPPAFAPCFDFGVCGAGADADAAVGACDMVGVWGGAGSSGGGSTDRMGALGKARAYRVWNFLRSISAVRLMGKSLPLKVMQ